MPKVDIQNLSDLNEALQHLTDASNIKTQRWPVDRIVQTAIGLILTGVLVWAGGTIQQLSAQVIELRATVAFHSDMMKQYVSTAEGHSRKLSDIETRLASLGGPADPLFPRVQATDELVKALAVRVEYLEKKLVEHATDPPKP